MKGLTKKHIIRTLIFAVITGLLIAADQITKTLVRTKISYTGDGITVIKNFFSITHVHNDGGMWGLFPGKVLPLAIIATVAAVILLLIASCSKPAMSQLAVFMILAGAVGNVIDRFRLKYVVDFLSFDFWGYKFPSFNLADSCVVIGAILLMIYVLFIAKEDTRMFIEGSPMDVVRQKREAKKAKEAENTDNVEDGEK